MPTEEEVRYPIGKFEFVQPAEKLRADCIKKFRLAPAGLNDAVRGLAQEQLLSRYRPDGWTLAQVVHHLVESDINAYVRLKYALTEDIPDVKIAKQERWAELSDARSPSLTSSLVLFEAIRMRWADAFESLNPKDFEKQWRHIRYGAVNIDFLLQSYVWHAQHHTAQIFIHRKSMGW
jgi:hypothetical protein